MSRVIANDLETEKPSKRMKTSIAEGVIVNITPPKRIVDVNNDCLERVFEFLEFDSLIHVAEANKFLKVVAEMVFVRKLKNRMIIVDDQWGHENETEYFYENAIIFRQPVLGFKVIRLFGHHVSEIYLRIYDGSSTLRKRLFLHANEYCHQTLNILNSFGDHTNIFGAVKHPFVNVKTFSSQEGINGPACEHLNRIFPRLCQLTLNENDVLDSKYILQAFPNLQTFISYYNYLVGDGDWPFNQFMDDDLKTITILNPQLQSITLVGYPPGIWELINTNLEHLKSIHLSYYAHSFDTFKGPPIQFNGVEILEITCLPPWQNGWRGSVDPTEVFHFKRLRKLKVKCYGFQLEMWIDFILAHPTIEELDIWLFNGKLPFYLELYERLRDKLNKVRQNTKFISMRKNFNIFYVTHIKKLPAFLEAHQWFDKFSLLFDELFTDASVRHINKYYEQIPEMKNYKLKKIYVHI